MTTTLPRVGHSFDAHRFSKQLENARRHLQLCCLSWPDEAPLEGHSDGDVAAHAVAEALLVAAGLGGMGENFGTSEPEWEGASGAAFIAAARERVEAAGFQVGNVCVQVIGNRPRLAGRAREAEEAIAKLVGAPVSVSATTTDGMGFTGSGEGLGAFATCLVFPR